MVRDTAVVTAASVVVAMAVLLREAAIASHFGVSDITDAFALASSTMAFLTSVIGGSLASSLIPVVLRVEASAGPTAAECLCREVLARMLLGALVIGIVIGFFSESVVAALGSDFSPDKRNLTRGLLVTMLPLIPVAVWGAYATAILQSQRHFFFSSLAPAMIPFVTVLAVQVLPFTSPHALAVSVVFGYAGQFLLLAATLKSRGIRWLLPKWSGTKPEEMGKVFDQYLPLITGAVLMGSTTIIDQAMAGMLGPGSVATFAFATVLVNYLNAFGGRTLGIPALSHFSRLVALGDWGGASGLMWRTLVIVGGAASVLTVLVWVFSDWLTAQVFERGAFNKADTARVALVQQYYALQLSFQFVGIVLVRMLSALGENSKILAVATLNFVVNIALNYLLMSKLGVAGIALSTSLVMCLSSLLCAVLVWRSLNARLVRERSV